MDNEPSTDLLPPKRPWGIWQWLLLPTPSLLMIVGATFSDTHDKYVGMVTALFTKPLASILCIMLGSSLATYTGKKGFFGWLICCLGVVAVNFAIVLISWMGFAVVYFEVFFVVCVRIIDSF